MIGLITHGEKGGVGSVDGPEARLGASAGRQAREHFVRRVGRIFGTHLTPRINNGFSSAKRNVARGGRQRSRVVVDDLNIVQDREARCGSQQKGTSNLCELLFQSHVAAQHTDSGCGTRKRKLNGCVGGCGCTGGRWATDEAARNGCVAWNGFPHVDLGSLCKRTRKQTKYQS